MEKRISQIEFRYNNAVKISHTFDKIDKRPLCVIFEGRTDDGITTILRMSAIILNDKFEVINSVISCSYGTETLELYLKEENKEIAVCDILRWGLRSDVAIMEIERAFSEPNALKQKSAELENSQI